MQIALISDIHGNLPALEAILAELDAESIDQVVCLGDVALFGPEPRQVLARLQNLGCLVVMGNTDAWALDPQPFDIKDEDSQRFFEVERWGAEQLSPSDLDYVRSFQPTVEMPLARGANLLCFHGSPQSYTHAILATTPDGELEPLLSGFHAPVMASGHTHTQMLRRFGDVTLINPGSAGLPIEPGPSGDQVHSPPWTEYAIVTCQLGGLQIEFRRIPFDINALTQAALGCGMPHAEWWVQHWRRE